MEFFREIRQSIDLLHTEYRYDDKIASYGFFEQDLNMTEEQLHEKRFPTFTQTIDWQDKEYITTNIETMGRRDNMEDTMINREIRNAFGY